MLAISLIFIQLIILAYDTLVLFAMEYPWFGNYIPRPFSNTGYFFLGSAILFIIVDLALAYCAYLKKNSSGFVKATARFFSYFGFFVAVSVFLFITSFIPTLSLTTKGELDGFTQFIFDFKNVILLIGFIYVFMFGFLMWYGRESESLRIKFEVRIYIFGSLLIGYLFYSLAFVDYVAVKSFLPYSANNNIAKKDLSWVIGFLLGLAYMGSGLVQKFSSKNTAKKLFELKYSIVYLILFLVIFLFMELLFIDQIIRAGGNQETFERFAMPLLAMGITVLLSTLIISFLAKEKNNFNFFYYIPIIIAAFIEALLCVVFNELFFSSSWLIYFATIAAASFFWLRGKELYANFKNKTQIPIASLIQAGILVAIYLFSFIVYLSKHHTTYVEGVLYGITLLLMLIALTILSIELWLNKEKLKAPKQLCLQLKFQLSAGSVVVLLLIFLFLGKPTIHIDGSGFKEFKLGMTREQVEKKMGKSLKSEKSDYHVLLYNKDPFLIENIADKDKKNQTVKEKVNLIYLWFSGNTPDSKLKSIIFYLRGADNSYVDSILFKMKIKDILLPTGTLQIEDILKLATVAQSEILTSHENSEILGNQSSDFHLNLKSSNSYLTFSTKKFGDKNFKFDRIELSAGESSAKPNRLFKKGIIENLNWLQEKKYLVKSSEAALLQEYNSKAEKGNVIAQMQLGQVLSVLAETKDGQWLFTGEGWLKSADLLEFNNKTEPVYGVKNVVSQVTIFESFVRAARHCNAKNSLEDYKFLPIGSPLWVNQNRYVETEGRVIPNKENNGVSIAILQKWDRHEGLRISELEANLRAYYFEILGADIQLSYYNLSSFNESLADDMRKFFSVHNSLLRSETGLGSPQGHAIALIKGKLSFDIQCYEAPHDNIRYAKTQFEVKKIIYKSPLKKIIQNGVTYYLGNVKNTAVIHKDAIEKVCSSQSLRVISSKEAQKNKSLLNENKIGEIFTYDESEDSEDKLKLFNYKTGEYTGESLASSFVCISGG